MALLLYQVPLIDADDQPLLVPLNDGEDIEVLPLNPFRRIQHQYADIAILNRTNAPKHRVVLQILIHLAPLTDTSCIHQAKLVSKLIIMRVYRVASGACNVGDNVSLLA